MLLPCSAVCWCGHSCLWCAGVSELCADVSAAVCCAGFPKALRAVTKGFTAPSPIQAQCWPIVLSGHDLIGNAATGSGEALACCLLLLHVAAEGLSMSWLRRQDARLHPASAGAHHGPDTRRRYGLVAVALLLLCCSAMRQLCEPAAWCAGKESKQPQALVLTPTRELAQQILGVATEAGSLVDLR